MTHTMHKMMHFFETGFIALTIHWQPVMGIVMSVCGSLYYVSMLKANVVDEKHGGSWKAYLKSLLKLK